jgi:hypothetical protein
MPCSVQLPAGAGKTQIIAAVGALASEAGERVLVLTHTNAGVDALRRRMRAFGVAASQVSVETIASWSHALVRHYPQLAQFSAPPVPDWADCRRYYTGAGLVASAQAIRQMLAASYDLAVVDEYQDCGTDQHALIVALSEALPIAVFGDPLQSIFDFGGNVPVTWETDVAARWPNLDLPVRPWRWVGHNEALGQWLIDIRADLMSGTPINLDGTAPVTWIAATPQTRTSTCYNQPANSGSVVAIGNLPYDCATQARALGGTYTVMEEIEGKEMLRFAAVVDQAKPELVAAATAEYGKRCAAKVAEALNPAVINKLKAGKPVTHLKRPGAENALQRLSELLTDPSPARIRDALVAIGAIDRIRMYRHDAWYTMLAALQIAPASNISVSAAVAQLRNRTRATGRRTMQRIVSRPVLIKGLEYDHAVVLDADVHTPTALYVALTRARQTLTILSQAPILRP